MQVYFLRAGTDTNIRRYEVTFECFLNVAGKSGHRSNYLGENFLKGSLPAVNKFKQLPTLHSIPCQVNQVYKTIPISLRTN
jgi:hypothetical protein